MGLFPNLPLAKFSSGVAPNQSLQQICLQPGEGDVTRPGKQSSQTLRTSLGHLTFKVNVPVERRLALQSLQVQLFWRDIVKTLLIMLSLFCASQAEPKRGLCRKSIEPRGICCICNCSSAPTPLGSGFFIDVCCLCLMSRKCLGFLRLHSMPWKHCCVHASVPKVCTLKKTFLI